jgi:H+/Cl- antiporter ClcA
MYGYLVREPNKMNELVKKIIAGALSGFVSAFLVDLNAWKSNEAMEHFNWALAIKRWLAGAVSGALTGLGMGQL